MERTVGDIGSLSACGSESSSACYCQLIAISWQPCWGQLTLGELGRWCGWEEREGIDLSIHQGMQGSGHPNHSENNGFVGEAHLENTFSHGSTPGQLFSAFNPPPKIYSLTFLTLHVTGNASQFQGGDTPTQTTQNNSYVEVAAAGALDCLWSASLLAILTVGGHSGLPRTQDSWLALMDGSVN